MARYTPEQDPALINRNRADILNQPMLRQGTDSDVMDFLDEVMTNPDVARPPGYGGEVPMNPQDYIRQILAGDVVNKPVTSQEEAIRRAMGIPMGPGTGGQQSIQNYGGRHSPYLDLMDILQFPSGQPYPRR